jgi:hypothetical protein
MQSTRLKIVNKPNFGYQTVVLIFEMILRIWSSSCINEYQNFGGKLKYFKSYLIMRSLDSLAIITFIGFIFVQIYTPLENLEVYIRFLHLFQVFQLYRLMFRIIKLMINTIYDQLNELYIALMFAILVFIFTTFWVYLVEKDENIDINNIQDAFWFMFITFTTIGSVFNVLKSNFNPIKKFNF